MEVYAAAWGAVWEGDGQLEGFWLVGLLCGLCYSVYAVWLGNGSHVDVFVGFVLCLGLGQDGS